jgi:uncharacterized protein YrrD
MSLPMPLPDRPHPTTPGDPHLRSAREVKGYHVEASDGDVGHVADFEVDDATWRIATLVADTGSWFHKREVLIKADSITKILWDESRVVVNLTRESIGRGNGGV